MIKVIDLFSGCGGFSHGFSMAGYNITTAVEFDKEIAKSYQSNHKTTKMIVDDIKNVDNNNIFKINDADVIIGGPPCQGFSMAGARIREGFIDDPRNYLFKHYINIVKIVKPKIFIMENVKGLMTSNNGEILKEIKTSFNSMSDVKYNIQYFIAKTKDFGIPQNRERIIIIGSQYNYDLQNEIIKTKDEIIKTIPTFFDNVSVWDAISNLPEPSLTGDVSNIKPNSPYQEFLHSTLSETYNHIKTNHSTQTLNRIKKIKINENFTKLNENIKSIHSGSYGRLDPNDISPTITTRFDTPSGGRFIHPYEHRTITQREAARIQSFPDDFKFIGTKSSINTQIGNAVPPKLAFFLAILVRRIYETKN